MKTEKQVNLLLVEDDSADVMGIERALKSLKVSNPLTIANDGLEALDHLRGENGKEKLRAPYIILLDLNMPRMNGIEFLQEIRKDDELKTAVVFVLTTSSSDEDKVKAYEQNIAGYIVKNDPTKSFMEAVGLIDYYWSIVELLDH
ncbi:MAG: response regulator [Pseudomonadota bacterium]